MALKKSEPYSSLWASCDDLRGGMDELLPDWAFYQQELNRLLVRQESGVSDQKSHIGKNLKNSSKLVQPLRVQSSGTAVARKPSE